MAASSDSYAGAVSQQNHPTITYQMIISNSSSEAYEVEPLDGVQLTRGRRLIPACLTFKVPMDNVLKFQEGATVTFKVNDTMVFKGFVFERSRDKENVISVRCYDQMRYLKNKDCLVYKNKTATEVLKMLCSDYGLKTDDSKNLADTGLKISHVEDNKTLADMINYTLAMTEIYGKGHPIYECYDDAGKICLKSITSPDMTLDCLLDGDVMENYSYTSSIDKETYDMVKIVREAPGEAGKALVKTGEAKDQKHIDQWGRLQFLMRPDANETNPVEAAKRFLTLHDCRSEEIKLKNVIGDVRVRGGSRVYVNMKFDDLTVSSYLVVDAVTHHFEENWHGMDLDLIYYERAGDYKVTYDNDAAVLEKIKEAEASKQGGKRYSGSGSWSNTEAGAYSKMKSLGATDAQAAGVMGNIQAEDSGYDPSITNDSGHKGLFQLDTNRWGRYEEWCSRNGLDPEVNDNQIEYVTTVENGNLFQQMPQDDPKAAAKWFNDNVEISGESGDDRADNASNYYHAMQRGTLTTVTPSYPEVYSDGGYVGGANPKLVDAGIDAVVTNGNNYFGENGCVRATTALGSYYNTDLKDAYDSGVQSVAGLETFMEKRGYQVETFNGYANKGDILIYGDDDHAVVSDGVGGCYSNATSADYHMVYCNANYAYADNEAPTKIIRMSNKS
ncbi:phage tail tip lysozyme [Acidaminococcus provencensis]|uniref:phage tail tip lysozyme n=1 Tax=Acidaminococcus provencensis TaxID=2058289 RepID=UPI000CF8ACDE|nr:phage tail tip lysozyme [Acidaminococcus provencensis]